MGLRRGRPKLKRKAHLVPDDSAVDGIADTFIYKSEFSVIVDELVFTS